MYDLKSYLALILFQFFTVLSLIKVYLFLYADSEQIKYFQAHFINTHFRILCRLVIVTFKTILRA